MNMQRLCSALVLSIFLLAGPLAGRAGAVLVPGDFDQDGDVDLADFADFQTCVLGSAIAQTDPVCTDARLDADTDVDLDDFAVFQDCLSGPDNPADPNCACPSGQTNCDGTCVSMASDEANCGACGSACAAGLVCQNGSCASCPGGQTLCFGVCHDLRNEISFCGTTCENAVACSVFETCTDGACQPVEPACGDVMWDSGNCGGCGIVCPEQTACAAGVCEGLCIGCE